MGWFLLLRKCDMQMFFTWCLRRITILTRLYVLLCILRSQNGRKKKEARLLVIVACPTDVFFFSFGRRSRTCHQPFGWTKKTDWLLLLLSAAIDVTTVDVYNLKGPRWEVFFTADGRAREPSLLGACRDTNLRDYITHVYRDKKTLRWSHQHEL